MFVQFEIISHTLFLKEHDQVILMLFLGVAKGVLVMVEAFH